MSKKYTIEEIKNIAIPIAKKYGVEKLALFGSYATGDNHENSDIDLLIQGFKSWEMFAFFGFANALEDAFGVKVDIMFYDSIPKSKYFGPVKEVVLYE